MDALAPDADAASADLSPLAWVLEEIRHSLEAASQAYHRYWREARHGAGGADTDTEPLRVARQQLHQAVGALEMVGLDLPARLLRAAEAAVQRLMEAPERCDEAALTQVEAAGHALLEFLEARLRGHAESTLQLFPQYQAMQALAGAERAHPADLWEQPWQWTDPATPEPSEPLAYATAVRARLDALVLRIVKSGDLDAAQALRDTALALAASQSGQARIFWKLVAATFEAVAVQRLALDIHLKRAASRVLLQYAALARGEAPVSERLALDLLFCCAQAGPGGRPAPVLDAVRAAWGLSETRPVDYDTPRFGRHDPALLAQARKRILAAKDLWSAVASGEAERFGALAEQFQNLGDLLVRLLPTSTPLARTLTAVTQAVARNHTAPEPELAMEVATALLYLEAAFEDLEAEGVELPARMDRLASRLSAAATGKPGAPLEPWIEALFRRVSDRHTMGSVVGELRQALADLEAALDHFFREPTDPSPLSPVPGHLGQMRGVLAVLGLDAAEHAVQAMRHDVEALLNPESPLSAWMAEADDPAPTPDRDARMQRLANNLGALGFLIDMLGYQPGLAKRVFVYDAQAHELRAPVSRPVTPPVPSDLSAQALAAVADATAVDERRAQLDTIATQALLADQPQVAESARVAADALAQGDEAAAAVALERLSPPAPPYTLVEPELVWLEEDLQGVFLQEAQDVLAHGAEAIAALSVHPESTEDLTALRRAFHTLKGSSRMVELREFGEAAWALEQVLNAWLADQRPATDDLLALTRDALNHLGLWRDAIAHGDDAAWSALPFRVAADALREHGVLQAIVPPEIAPRVEVLADDETKCIGELRIPIPLFNVYLAEADEWSRRLLTALEEWQIDPRLPVPEDCVAWAHSLAGSSATVGFSDLATLARALEHALDDVRDHGLWDASRPALFAAGAEGVRRLLHQFAAGFLHAPEADLLQRLAERAPEPVAEPLPVEAMLPEPEAAFEPEAQPEPESVSEPAPDTAFEIAPNAGLIELAAPRRAPDAQAHAQADDLDVADAIDPELFPLFAEEGAELFPQLAAALRRWLDDPSDLSARDAALRTLHTLKGSARLAGALRLGERVHRMESQAEALGRDAVNPVDIDALLQRADSLQAEFDQLRGVERTEAAPEPVLAAPALRPVTLALTQTPQGGAVRVRGELLERMLNQAGEVMITRSRLEAELTQLRGSLGDLTGNLDRLRGQLREIELQAETQMQTRQAQSGGSAADFDPLEFDRYTRVQELTRMMAESVNDVATIQRTIQRTVEATEDDLASQARQARELQRDLLRTRMVEFDALSERLYRVIRQAAKEEGKQVRLDIEGGRTELDRSVLDRVVPAFEHLLRNSVVHGIESPEQRTAAGKDPVGAIRIALRQEGNDVAIVFSDDGAGLHLQRIRERALSLGLVTPDQVLSDAEVANLIFAPGLTTAEQLSDIAGRGIGMDVVRAEIAALGGRVDTSTEAGRGTQFTLVLPLTTAVTQVVMVRMGALTIGVPANLVERVLRTPREALALAHAEGALTVGDEALAFHWGGALLRSSARSTETAEPAVPVAVFRSAAQRVAWQVDEVMGNREVVVKPLGPQLSRLPGLTGMSLLPDGEVVLIYNPVALVQVFGAVARQWALSASGGEGSFDAPSAARPAVDAPAPLVMVVDDSITVRRVTQRLLQREGYRVTLAADGLQALEMLARELPAVVLSDIEMPRMDGFDLLRNIRRQPRLASLPVVMITSRIAAKHRDHAMALGANHYLGKPYAEDALLALLRGYTAPADPLAVLTTA